MIEERDILPRLVQACPEYAPVLAEFLREEAEEGRTERLTYNGIGDFVEWLLRRVAAGRTTDIEPVAAELELLLTEGDNVTRQFATIGLIEDIQNGCAEMGVDPDLFMGSLGAVGRVKWTETVR